MHRYWLAAACAALALSLSACKKNEGILPRTDDPQSAPAPAADPGSKDTAGKTAPGGY